MEQRQSLKLWYNGLLRDRADVEFITNRAFRYGDGLIETIRMMRGELLFFHDHIERMLHGMQALMMPAAPHRDARFFYECISRVLEGNGLATAARIRIQVWRTGEGLYAPVHQGVDFLIEVAETDEGYAFNESGLSAGVMRGVRKTHDRLSNVKTSSALTYVLAALEAQEQKVNVGFVLNERNTIADAPGRNVFIVEEGKVVTPPLTDACVAGVFRMQLLELLRSHKIVTLEESISPERLGDADEIFVTNVTDGIQPVTTFGGKTYGSNQTKELFKLFSNHLLHAGD